MKHVKFFLPALVLFLALPGMAHAAPLSPWVQEVLNRADAGLLAAQDSRFAPSNPCTPESRTTDQQNARQLISDRALAVNDLTRRAAMLTDSTVCFAQDEWLFTQKLEEIRVAILNAVDTCNFQSYRVLADTYEATADAYKSFLTGAHDPSYQDTRLYTRSLFENADWWLGVSTPTTPLNQPLCPFTTDYGPHAIGFVPSANPVIVPPLKSFGCDSTMLLQIDPAFPSEAADQLAFMDAYQTFGLQLINIVAPGTFSSSPPPHQTIAGCFTDVNASSQVITEQNGIDRLFPVGALIRSTFNAFSALPDALGIERIFLEQKGFIGSTRPLPGAHLGTAEDMYSFFTKTFSAPQALTGESASLERRGGTFESMHREAIERSQNAAGDLLASVDELIHVTEYFLPEQYTPNYVYFLARNCVDSECQNRLQTIIQRSFNPFCHPYVSGRYLDENAAKRCFCDPSIQAIDPDFWDDYCSANYDAADYANRQDPQILECTPEADYSVF